MVKFILIKFILIKSPDVWAITKQSCRDELVGYLFFSPIYNSLYFLVLSTVLRISSFTLYIYIYIYLYIKPPDEWATTKQSCRDELVVYLFFSSIYSSLYFYTLSTVLRTSSFTLLCCSEFRAHALIRRE